MTISDKIRALAAEGFETAEIARRLNIRYQHAYKVLRDANNLTHKPRVPRSIRSVMKQPLTVEELQRGGFQFSGRWVLDKNGSLISDRKLPKEIGVYAFAKENVVLYVGVATMGLSKRLYFYGKPGASQLTSLRINAQISEVLQTERYIDIYTVCPPDLEWNGFPIHGSAGLELGLIKKYNLPWNVRSARS